MWLRLHLALATCTRRIERHTSESECDVEQEPNKNTSRSTGILAQAPWGLAVLLGFVTVLCSVVWLARAREATIPDAVFLTLICFSFGWTGLSIWQLQRGGRKLGWNRSNRPNYTQLLSGPPPDDPDLLFLWRWTLQLCYASLAVVLCILAVAFAA